MTMPRARRAVDAVGFQHADDEYYYRPLVAGEELFTYIAHVPPGGYMPPDAEEAKLFELSLFMVEGELTGILGESEMRLTPGDALHIPRGMAFGVDNKSAGAASFILSFAPPPRAGDIDTMLADARAKGRRVYAAEEFGAIVGDSAYVPQRSEEEE